MKFRYQFGFDLHFFIFWRTVPTEKFGKKIAPLILRTGQEATITPEELLPMFTKDFILRDGWRLFRAIPME
jgi:hypothetical protein